MPRKGRVMKDTPLSQGLRDSEVLADTDNSMQDLLMRVCCVTRCVRLLMVVLSDSCAVILFGCQLV